VLGSTVIFLDFNRDTSSHSNDTTLAEELSRNGSEALSLLPAPVGGRIDSMRADPARGDSALLRAVREAGEAGSPEALTMMGRWYETGRLFRKDNLAAAVCYLRALRFDSPRAPELLWRLVHGQGFFAMLKAEVDRGSTDAEFVWAALIGAQFDFQLTGEQAVALLERAAGRNNVQAMLELGSWMAQGRLVARDRKRAFGLWQRAAAIGSREAEIRLAVAQIMADEPPEAGAELVPKLQSAMREGSVLAQVALGYCFEHGIGLPQQTGEGARLYRSAAQRGSSIGYSALKRMYDGLRPTAEEFRVDR
jgi:TPR repeat protein